MNQEERIIYLIQYLQEHESVARYRDADIPKEIDQQRLLLRALMNIREPYPVSDEFLSVQDKYLQERLKERGTTTIEEIKDVYGDLYLWKGDITTLAVDGIVNAANNQLLGCFGANHLCIDNAIHTYAGVQLRNTCAEIVQKQGHLEPTGSAKITPAYNLPSKYVIHTVGPIVQGILTKESETLLASCYRSCLEIAEENHLFSIAFCCISTGVFGYPPEPAAETAIQTVQEYKKETGSNIKVIFNVFSEADERIYRRLLEGFPSIG